MRAPVRSVLDSAISVSRFLLVLLALGATALPAQSVLPLYFVGNGHTASLDIDRSRGYPAVPARRLRIMEASVRDSDGGVRILLPTEVEPLTVFAGNPFVRIGDRVEQLAEAPYRMGGELYLPMQLLTDVLPSLLPEFIQYRSDDRTLLIRRSDTGEMEPAPAPAGSRRVVVIDAGHGGKDPGARQGGVSEKTVALDIALALAEALDGDPTLDVRLTRDDDEFIPLWDRGAMANETKGDAPGLFMSIHLNSIPGGSSSVRGYETYFLAEARTEHERRVAAIENAPLALETGDDAPLSTDPALDQIFRELRNLDHQHWSALLARLVQDEMGRVHPGPNRGVKQAGFAVLTNALMPAVLVEVGFLSNPAEREVITDEEFHRDIAESLAQAIRSFFDRYDAADR